MKTVVQIITQIQKNLADVRIGDREVNLEFWTQDGTYFADVGRGIKVSFGFKGIKTDKTARVKPSMEGKERLI